MEDMICQSAPPAARLRVTGSDAATFLQGQFSNDLRRSDAAPVTYGLWLNHKGRVLADSWVLQRDGGTFEILSRTSPGPLIRERLETYIIADDVAVDDLTASTGGILLAGEGAAGVLRERGWTVPARGCYGEGPGGLVLEARCGHPATWYLVGDNDAMGHALDALRQAGVREVAPEVFEARRIAAGIPSVPHELGPEDLPMEGGLERDAISFTKGCYLGQEVMARLHNLGQVRRRLFLVRHVGDGPVPAGQIPLYAGATKLGELRSSVVRVETGERFGLALLQVNAAKPGLLLSAEPEGAPVLEVLRVAEGRLP